MLSTATLLPAEQPSPSAPPHLRKASRHGGTEKFMWEVRTRRQVVALASWMRATLLEEPGTKSGRHSRSIATQLSVQVARSAASAAGSASARLTTLTAMPPGSRKLLLEPGAGVSSHPSSTARSAVGQSTAGMETLLSHHPAAAAAGCPPMLHAAQTWVSCGFIAIAGPMAGAIIIIGACPGTPIIIGIAIDMFWGQGGG